MINCNSNSFACAFSVVVTELFMQRCVISPYSSRVEQNTVNIWIDVQFILRARFRKFRRVSLMVELCVSATSIQVQVLYTFQFLFINYNFLKIFKAKFKIFVLIKVVIIFIFSFWKDCEVICYFFLCLIFIFLMKLSLMVIEEKF